MDIIRRKTDYGLRALVALARAERPMRAEELAEQEQAPVAFLHKALTDLANAGIVEGQRGPTGGFTLARRAKEITVLEAVEVMQGPLAVSRCLLGDEGCPRQEVCGLKWAWEKVQQTIASFLRNLTIEDLARALGPAPTRRRRRAAAARAATCTR
jgi:Rrf2 family protein